MEQLQTLQFLGQPAQTTARLMIVDDEMMVTASLEALLGMETNHEIYCFNNPVEALQAIDPLKPNAINPNLIISDFSMPEMDGISFLKAAKAKLPDVTMILLTGYADKESAIEAINKVGLYRYIEKPWNNDDLKISIQNGLERTQLISRLKATIADLTVAHAQLEETNAHLEELVITKTQDLQSTYQTLKAIVNNTADGIITLDNTLTITYVNPTIENWIKQESQPVGWQIQNILRTHFSPEKPNQIETLLNQKEHLPFYEVFIEELPLEMSIAKCWLPQQNGLTIQQANHQQSQFNLISISNKSRIDGFVLVLRDIKARKEIERLREDFVSTLTHDLRTPLLAAIQTLGFFADGTLGKLNPRQSDLITMLIASNRELLGLVNVLLEVYKYESGRYKLICSPIVLTGLIQHIIDEMTALASSRGQIMRLQLPQPNPDQVITVFGDKQELKRVFTNIIGNAIHYTPQNANGQIEIALQVLNKTIQVCVQDNGRGIPRQDIPQLFQRFSQGTSKQRSSGSGLGLFLSRQILEAHQGKIWVESQEGIGSCFYIELPLHTDI